jgi:RNA-binding protein YlmH
MAVASENDAVLEARIRDVFRLAESGRRPRFAGFLDERQALVARRIANSEGFSNFLLWGGYEEAERVYVGVFPDFMRPREENFPFMALTVSYRSCDRLTHRDLLGALLHVGVERSALGDILVEEGRSVLFCRNELSEFLSSQVSKIGGVGVKLSEGAAEPLPEAHRFEEFSSVVASPRLDCVVAAAVGTSREKASEMIRASLVMVNHAVSLSPDARVREGDLLSIRGQGRFVLDRLGPVTKKGRLGIAGRKYV